MPGSTRTAPSWVLLLRLLALLRPPGLGEACSCAPAHPQQHVCHSALVIRVKVSSEKVVPASADPADTQKMIRYEIKQIKMFKGFEKVKDVQYIYTPFDSSLCGVKLEANSQKQYLLTDYRRFSGPFIEPHVATATKKPLERLQFWVLHGSGPLELQEQIPDARLSPHLPLKARSSMMEKSLSICATTLSPGTTCPCCRGRV
ncbi:metalloproteinase inhibitor 4 isoform X2 [Cynocephalus volans]|uniref:metalloproteinase inhibitor 4 isoform X2 n=1 Tax=Cynocephalus volans TaxID=110931 RepID=UPI002FC79AAC